MISFKKALPPKASVMLSDRTETESRLQPVSGKNTGLILKHLVVQKPSSETGIPL